MISQFLLIIPMPTVDKRIWTSDPSLRRRMLYPAELCRHTIFGLKSRFFSLFDHPDRWPIFSIFSRYFFRRKCYLRPLQHLAFLIKILSTELPSTPEYFSKVLSTGPPLGGERSILLSYRDIKKIWRLSFRAVFYSTIFLQNGQAPEAKLFREIFFPA